MFTRICREIVDVAIYALYPESFCGVNLAIRKVFAFSDSAEEMLSAGSLFPYRSPQKTVKDLKLILSIVLDFLYNPS